MTRVSGSLFNIDNEARCGMLAERCTPTDIERIERIEQMCYIMDTKQLFKDSAF